MIVRSGLEVLRNKGYKPLQGQRVGLLTNPSAIDRNFDNAHSILCNDERVNVTALFAPEHGLLGALSEGERFGTETDSKTGLPVYSLYGDNLRPTQEMFEDIDVIVCDIQDIGVRYYTFTWTISHLLEAAGEYGVTVVLLDRPNPLGGKTIYGPPLTNEFTSLVGRYPVPVIHGMTLGEIIWMINETWNPHLARLSIIPCERWEREITWKQTKMPWVPPSPNIPNLHTLRNYPGACLLEGTNLSEGRGTTMPFEITGAPWIDGSKLATHLNGCDWIEDCGVRFRAHAFRPSQNKYTGEHCQGVQAHIVDEDNWNAIKTWLNVIATIRHLYPDDFAWSPVNPATGYSHFDRLIGSSETRQAIDDGITIGQLIPDWLVAAAEFKENRRPFLLYE